MNLVVMNPISESVQLVDEGAVARR